jgi:hypothetical protein
MLQKIRSNKKAQLGVALVLGFFFGFFMQRGGLSEFDVIVGQLLLEDFTVVKIMFTAILVGMILVYASKGLGWVRLHPKSGSVGKSWVGGLIFGVAFALLGLCSGTAAAAVAQGSLDALVGGVPGILLGSWLFAVWYPKLQKPVLMKVSFGKATLPEVLGVNPWVVVIPAALLIVGLLAGLEAVGR